MKAYKYSILRYRRSKSAGELVNIGLLMVVPDDRRAYRFVSEKYSRLSDFFGDFDGNDYRIMVRDVIARIDSKIELFEPETQGTFPQFTSFRLSATPDINTVRATTVAGPESCFQWSSVRGGLHPDPEVRFNELVEEFLLRHEQKQGRPRLDESAIISTVNQTLKDQPYRDKLTAKVLRGKHSAQHEFPVSWVNGMTHVLDGISFDYTTQTTIDNKAHKWCGMLHNLTNGEEFRFIGVTAPPPKKGLLKAYERALRLIDDMEQTRKVVEIDDAPNLAATIANDLAT